MSVGADGASRVQVNRIVTIVALGAVAACGSSPLTASRLERALAPTFANLVHTQVAWLGLPAMAPADVKAEATCRRVSGGPTGAGEWTCAVSWTNPERRQLRDIYDVAVTTDGCYSATVEGESLGGPVLTAADGRRVRNLLHTFEGCFGKSS